MLVCLVGAYMLTVPYCMMLMCMAYGVCCAPLYVGLTPPPAAITSPNPYVVSSAAAAQDPYAAMGIQIAG